MQLPLALVTISLVSALVTQELVATRVAVTRTNILRGPNGLRYNSEPSNPPSPYWANDTLVGMPLACSDANKRCLDVNRLVDPATGRCYELGDPRPCNSPAVWAVDKSAIHKGRLQGHCYRPRRCDGNSGRMAYDGRCYNFTYAKRALCGNGFDLAYHPFGDWECASVYGAGTPTLAQPSMFPSCVFPYFRPAPLQAIALCDHRAAECGERGLLVAASGECAAALSSVGCSIGGHLVLDADALGNGWLGAYCAARDPCPRGEILLRGRCRSQRDVNHTLCHGEALVQMPTGQWECLRNYTEGQLRLYVKYIGGGFCHLRTEFSNFAMAIIPNLVRIICPRDNSGRCTTPIEEGTEHIDLFAEDHVMR